MSALDVELPSPAPRSRPRRTMGIVFEVISLALIALLVWYLWPQSLGGGQQMVSVNGHSMDPTYRSGDLLIVRPNDRPDVGDVLVYRIPKGDPGEGNMVVHRVIDYRDDGSIVTQGDNRDTADSFRVTTEDIVGSPVVVIPYGATVVRFVGSPLGLALVAGALMTLLLWPERQRPTSDESGDESAGDHPDFATVLDIEEFMADAYAWVESQLADVESGTSSTSATPAEVDPWAEYGSVDPRSFRKDQWSVAAEDWLKLELAELATTGTAVR